MSRWIPPQLVHRIVQYSQPARPGMTRMTTSPASHCGQLDSTVAENFVAEDFVADDILAEDGAGGSLSNRSMAAVLCDSVNKPPIIKPPIIPSAAALMSRIA